MKVSCTNCGHEGYQKIPDGELVTKQYCPICLCQTLIRDTSTEGVRIALPANYFLEGTIVNATWEKAIRNNDPYIDLTIESRENPPRTFLKPYTIITPLLPGMASKMAILQSITGAEIKVPKRLRLGSTIPELIGRDILMEIEYLELDGQLRHRVAQLSRVKKGE